MQFPNLHEWVKRLHQYRSTFKPLTWCVFVANLPYGGDRAGKVHTCMHVIPIQTPISSKTFSYEIYKFPTRFISYEIYKSSFRTSRHSLL